MDGLWSDPDSNKSTEKKIVWNNFGVTAVLWSILRKQPLPFSESTEIFR